MLSDLLEDRVVVQPTGGLTARIQVIGTAVALARDVGKPLHMVWNLAPECNCPFDRLFERPPEIAGIRQITGGQPLPFKAVLRLRRRLDLRQPPSVPWIHDWDHVPPPPEVMKATGARWRPYLQTVHGFYPSYGVHRLFRPVPALAERIAAGAEDRRARIGVHIRRTDHVLARQHSQTGDFLSRMQAEIDAAPGAGFFLSTDDPEVEAELLAAFPGRIRVNTRRSLDRNDPIAIEDAVVDLFSLATTRRMLGCYQSIFSRTASDLGPIPLEVIRSVPGAAG